MGTTHHQNLAQRYASSIKPSPAISERKNGGGQTSNIFLLHARDYTGEIAYYFLQVPPLRLPQFHKANKSSAPMDLEIYGEILASGYGEATESVREDIRSRFGWDG